MSKTLYKAGEYYHIYNRGVNRQPIFFEDHNWTFFLRRLRKYFSSDRANIIAFCLMPNHYHLLVYLKIDEFSHKVMQPFGTSYTKAINKEQDRVGSLFQGRFKGKLIKRDDYLLHLSRYIHRNPVEAGLVSHPSEWEYSSYRDFTAQRNDPLVIPEFIMEQFGSVEEYESFVEEGDADYSLLRDILLD